MCIVIVQSFNISHLATKTCHFSSQEATKKKHFKSNIIDQQHFGSKNKIKLINIKPQISKTNMFSLFNWLISKMVLEIFIDKRRLTFIHSYICAVNADFIAHREDFI
ncbi:hypothetical protein Dimus_027128 [Dionaea muscipula]